jgi:hypothetical protein
VIGCDLVWRVAALNKDGGVSVRDVSPDVDGGGIGVPDGEPRIVVGD